MSGMASLFVRCCIMLVGYAAAVLAASTTLHLLWLAPFGATLEENRWLAGSLAISVPVLALFVAYYAFFPALLAMVATEATARRDWLTHAISGGLVGLGVVAFGVGADLVVGSPDDVEPMWSAEPYFLLSLVCAGMVGGLAYWACAGRWAAPWRRDPPIAPGSSGS